MKFSLLIAGIFALVAIAVLYIHNPDILKKAFNIPNVKFTGGQPMKVSTMTGAEPESTLTMPVIPGGGGKSVPITAVPGRFPVSTENQTYALPYNAGPNSAQNYGPQNYGPPATQTYNPYANPTPQAKMIDINDLLGNPGIAKQQGATRILYDALPLDARVTFNFFREVNTRVFPFTNLTENRLGVGEAMVVENIYFAVMTTVAGAVTLVAPLSAAAGTAGLYSSQFNFAIAQSQTLKNIPLFSMQSIFNDQAKFLNNDVLRLRTLQVIPPLFEFTLDLRTTAYAAIALTHLLCVMEGAGCLLSPKQTL